MRSMPASVLDCVLIEVIVASSSAAPSIFKVAPYRYALTGKLHTVFPRNPAQIRRGSEKPSAC
jgi:hypothetical protein